jgi:hypothetical protein
MSSASAGVTIERGKMTASFQKGKHLSIVVLVIALILAFGNVADTFHHDTSSSASSGTVWLKLEEGLDLGIFPSPVPSEIGDSKIRVLRIDPERFQFLLLNATAPGQGQPFTAKEWCQRNGLVAAINASMYQEDHRTSVSLMRTRTHVNNDNLSKDNSILAFDREDPDVPCVKIIDKECEDLNAWRKNYGTLVQSIRMISCRGKNVWTQQPKKWSTAAIGTDLQERVLLIHVASPYSTHDLIEILMDLPLQLDRAMYVEGGPEAQLYVRSGDREYEYVGCYETGFVEIDLNYYAWPIPNVVGIARRKSLFGNDELLRPVEMD